MEKVEGVYTYQCKECEAVFGIVSRFGVSQDQKEAVPCPGCKGMANLYGEGHIKYSVYGIKKNEKETGSTTINDDYLKYPIVLNAKHVSEIIGISLRRAYEIMDWNEFPSFKVGSRKFVNRESFFDWMAKKK
jgi:predicted DNA-binding transcriptional regulator AlpA